MPPELKDWLPLIFQVVALAAFLGGTRQIVKGLEEAISKLSTWAADIDKFRRESETDRGRLTERLNDLEGRNTTLDRLHEIVIEQRTESRLRFDRLEKSGDRVDRDLQNIQRQFSNMMTDRGGQMVEMAPTAAPRQPRRRD